MLLVKNTGHVGEAIDDKTALRVIKNAGFDAADFFGMARMRYGKTVLCEDTWRAYVEDLRRYADSLSLPFVQGHAPWPTYDYNNPTYSERIWDCLVRCLEISAILGIKHLIVHPVQLYAPGDDAKEVNMAFYRKLLPYAKEFDVKICLENMWGWDKKRNRIIPDVCSWAKDFADYIDTLDSPYLTACLDLGHSAVIGEDAEDAIRILGHDRLSALHVHDTTLIEDSHTLPYYGKMNWDAICQALHDIHYAGNFTYEADSFLSPLPADEKVFTAATTFMAAVGRYLIKKIGL